MCERKPVTQDAGRRKKPISQAFSLSAHGRRRCEIDALCFGPKPGSYWQMSCVSASCAVASCVDSDGGSFESFELVESESEAANKVSDTENKKLVGVPNTSKEDKSTSVSRETKEKATNTSSAATFARGVEAVRAERPVAFARGVQVARAKRQARRNKKAIYCCTSAPRNLRYLLGIRYASWDYYLDQFPERQYSGLKTLIKKFDDPSKTKDENMADVAAYWVERGWQIPAPYDSE